MSTKHLKGALTAASPLQVETSDTTCLQMAIDNCSCDCTVRLHFADKHLISNQQSVRTVSLKSILDEQNACVHDAALSQSSIFLLGVLMFLLAQGVVPCDPHSAADHD